MLDSKDVVPRISGVRQILGWINLSCRDLVFIYLKSIYSFDTTLRLYNTIMVFQCFGNYFENMKHSNLSILQGWEDLCPLLESTEAFVVCPAMGQGMIFMTKELPCCERN